MRTVISKNRLEALSDGVFAIILTLLVLELKVPELHHQNSTTELAAYLMDMGPVFGSWVLSFFLVCVTYIHHHRLLEHIQVVDTPLFFLNAILLLTISSIPFPTGLVGHFPANPLAVSSLGVVLALCGLAFNAIRRYALHKGMLKTSVNRTAFLQVTNRQLVFGPGTYLAAAAMAWVYTPISLMLYVAISLYFMLRPAEAWQE